MILPLAPVAFAMEVTIDATTPAKTPEPLAFAVGGKSPDGHVLSANSRYLTLDGRPWFPVMGEFHFSRYPAAEWETELLKMKAGGINVVSTYVFWIHHEETEGKFDWSGQRDLRRFIELCGKHGLLAWVRIGPWDHGEARNGGFPDWLVKRGGPTRTNDPAYLEKVRIFYGEIGRQLKGLFWQDGGPIAGVQIENEYHPGRGGIEHMQTLLQLAHEAGIDAPFYTATGWDNATIPPTGFLPVFGGYTEQFWSASLEELPPNQNFFFTAIRAEDNVMGDLTPKNPGYNSKYDGFPFLTAEMGGGMSIAYHRRPLMGADDSTAAALVKVGAGITGLGYYMYHGGTNPDGLTSLQETQSVWNGYNDMEAKSYDFQAPLREFGQFNASYRTMRALHLFLHDFGARLAPMAAYFPAQTPKNRDDVTTPRVTLRTDGTSGFIFINNYQRLHPLGPKADFQVSLHLPTGTVEVPRQSITIPDGVYTHWPVNLTAGGVTLRYATAELLCQLDDPDTLVFSAWPGLGAEFALVTAAGDTVNAPRGKVTRADGGITFVDGLTPGTDIAIEVVHADKTRTQILVLPRNQALLLAKTTLGDHERLVLSPGNLYFDGSQIHVSARDSADLKVGIFPVPQSTGDTFVAAAREGVFQQYVLRAAFQSILPREKMGAPAAVEITAVKPAAPSAPAKLNPNPRRHVAMEPDDADFARAAEWNLRVSPGSSGVLASRAFLEISYVGDVARLYVGDRFDNDNFYKGTPWEIALWRFTPEELSRGLDLKILPLRADTPLYLAAGMRPDFPGGADALQLKSVKVVREYEAVLDAR
ncbi:MAG TPA: beta-galactosidase [Opitutaceae bacterium]|nr:beta-galactosidase [Opitutaceae bacterium]